jgi:diacylglycerol O-acyltransferase
VSLIVVDLPVDEPDPIRRLVELHRRTVELRESGLVDGADSIVRLADGVPLLSTQLTRLVSRRIPMNLVITNIPGPPVPLYLRGARVLRTYPYVEVIDNEGLTIAVVSYDDQMFFGITSDRDVLPDLALVAEGIEKEFQALAAGAGA